VEPVRYRFVVEGELGPRYAAAFEDMSVERGDGTTEIVGMVRDQSHLQGLLDQVSGLGLKLVSVARDNG
jgi:hypothetical protein